MLWTSNVIYLVTPLLWLVKTPADMNELRDLHSSALILIASKIIMAMLAIHRGFHTSVLHFFKYSKKGSIILYRQETNGFSDLWISKFDLELVQARRWGGCICRLLLNVTIWQLHRIMIKVHAYHQSSCRPVITCIFVIPPPLLKVRLQA